MGDLRVRRGRRLGPDHGVVEYLDPDLLAAKQAADAAEREAAAEAALLAFAQNDATTSGLTWGYRHTGVRPSLVAGGYQAPTPALILVPDGTRELEPSATNYVQWNVTEDPKKQITVNQTGFTPETGALALWEIETGAYSIIRRTDRRRWLTTNGTVTEVSDGGGDPHNKIQTITFDEVPAQMLLKLDDGGTDDEIITGPSLTNENLQSFIESDLGGYAGKGVTITGTRTTATDPDTGGGLVSGTFAIETTDPARTDSPDLTLTSGPRVRFTVEDGDNGSYSVAGCTPFGLGTIDAETLAAAVTDAVGHTVYAVGSAAGGTSPTQNLIVGASGSRAANGNPISLGGNFCDGNPATGVSIDGGGSDIWVKVTLPEPVMMDRVKVTAVSSVGAASVFVADAANGGDQDSMNYLGDLDASGTDPFDTVKDFTRQEVKYLMVRSNSSNATLYECYGYDTEAPDAPAHAVFDLLYEPAAGTISTPAVSGTGAAVELVEPGGYRPACVTIETTQEAS